MSVVDFLGRILEIPPPVDGVSNLRRKKTKSWIKDQRDPSNSMKIVRKSTRSI